MIPQTEKKPKRLLGPNAMQRLPAWQRLSPKQVEEMSPKNLAGAFSGMTFPHSTRQFGEFGPEWFTKAFRKFGTLPSNNSVKHVVRVEELPFSGFDAAGGAGHKAFITVEYEREDPDLHTELFAKMPWDYFESDTGRKYRLQMSTYSDMDGPELETYVFCEHLFPFRIPKLYFCDLSRETTNFVLITERLKFGNRGRVEKGQVVEKIERKPFELLPVCGKYQDFLLDDPASVYFCLFRAMGRLAAWDHAGRYEQQLGPKQHYTAAQFLENAARPRFPKKRAEAASLGAAAQMDTGIQFASSTAPQLFSRRGRDPRLLEKMKRELCEMAPHFQDFQAFFASSSDYVAAMHLNLQADNAYFWRDDHGDLDCGVLDWCGFNRVPFVANFMGCLSGADSDLLDAHEESLMRCFADEYARYGGPHLDLSELVLKWRLCFCSYLVDCCQWIERDVLPETPQAEWKTIKDKFDHRFMDRWNVRCRTTALINAFDFYSRREFKRIFDEWKAGTGKPYLTSYNK